MTIGILEWRNRVLEKGPKILLNFLFSSLFMGCASLKERSRHQFVFIQSEPPGALISQDGVDLGTTPSVIRIKREFKPNLELKLKNERHILKLKTSYRWIESGLLNFYLGGLSVVGWSVDLITGAAWDITDPEIINLGIHELNQGKKPKTLAIAPPISGNHSLSDQWGDEWNSYILKNKKGFNPLNYHETLPHFLAAGFDFDVSASNYSEHTNLRKVLHSSKATEILVSEVETRDSKTTLVGYTLDPNGQKVEKDLRLPIAVPKQSLPLPENFSSLQGLLPNSLGLDFYNDSLTVSLENGGAYDWALVPSEYPAWDRLTNSISAINLSYLIPPRFDSNFRSRFQWVSALSGSIRTVFFPSFRELAGVSFESKNLGVGFGFEACSIYRGWNFYFRALPFVDWTSLEWEQPEGGRRSKSAWSSSLVTRIGIRYFLNNSLSVEVYGQYHPENKVVWGEAFKTINPTVSRITSIGKNSGGYTLNYSF